MAEATEILLADDSEVGRYVIATTLRRAGFEVREVSDGVEALREVLGRPPDLAILDVKMPGLNGMEVCRQIKADPSVSSVPVLLLSATFLDDSYRVEGLDIGADAYLTQPVEGPVLIASIRSLLRTRVAERAERMAATEWQVTFDAIGDAVALLDAGSVIRRCNRAFAALTGVSTEGAAGRSIDELFPGFGESIDAAGVIEIAGREFVLRVDDLTDSESTSRGVLTLRDVTAERELERTREQALQRERLISTTLQEALAPGRLPAIPGLSLSAKYVLGEAGVVVGGDWFDVIPTSDGVWLTVGDNAGHGVIATARAVQLRNNLRLLADEGYAPTEAMERLSSVLQSADEIGLASAIIIVVRPDGHAEYVCAGHPPALRLRPGNETVRLGEHGGPVLGFPRASYTAVPISVQPGDTLVLYTDGLIERRGELIDVGIERLVTAAEAAPPGALAEQAFAALLPERPADDAAILVARITAPPTS